MCLFFKSAFSLIFLFNLPNLYNLLGRFFLISSIRSLIKSKLFKFHSSFSSAMIHLQYFWYPVFSDYKNHLCNHLLILMLDQQTNPKWRPPRGQLQTLHVSLSELADLATELLCDPPAAQPVHHLSIMNSLLHLMTDVETQLAGIRETLEVEWLRYNDWLLSESFPSWWRFFPHKNWIVRGGTPRLPLVLSHAFHGHCSLSRPPFLWFFANLYLLREFILGYITKEALLVNWRVICFQFNKRT